MRISFIVPMYNEEMNIKRCIESILSEMQGDDELIVVDNGSSDRSNNICIQYARLRLLTLPRNTIGAARNYGSNFAKNELIAFIDADCEIVSGWRNSVIKAISNDNIAAVGSRYQIPTSPHIIEKVWYSQKLNKVSKVKYINSGNFIIKKTVFVSLGGFNEKLITGEDAELGWRINKEGYIIVEDPEIICIHHGNPKSIMEFYRKQKWHAVGMLGTFRVSFYDKPFLMTCFFICSLLSATYFLMIRSICFLIISILLIPSSTAIYRVIQYNKIWYLIHYMILYTIYYIARSHALIEMVLFDKKRFSLMA